MMIMMLMMMLAGDVLVSGQAVSIPIVLWNSYGIVVTNTSEYYLLPIQTNANRNFKGNDNNHLVKVNLLKYNFNHHQNENGNNQPDIEFIYYKNGKKLFSKKCSSHQVEARHNRTLADCSNEKTTFILHGWSETCNTSWVIKLIERLTYYRDGCIVCIDYRIWSQRSYPLLRMKFTTIANTIYEELLKLVHDFNWQMERSFVFGFSFGGQLASSIGQRLQPHYRIGKMDICDIAGPGFDYVSNIDHRLAAENVQCYHSSVDKGSHFYRCHQNIRLGQCGFSQPAVLSQPYFSSHGLCVQIYINAFDYKFYALREPAIWCNTRNIIATNLTEDFTIGYKDEYDYRNISGDIFVPTGLNYPYNLSKKELILYHKYMLTEYGVLYP